MIRTAPLWASAYPRSHWRREGAKVLTHAAEFNAEGEAIRVLCGRIQLDSVCTDDTQHTDETPTCTRCARLINQQRSAS